MARSFGQLPACLPAIVATSSAMPSSVEDSALADMSPLQARLLKTYMSALDEQEQGKDDDDDDEYVREPPPPPPPKAVAPTKSRSDLYAKTMGDLLLKGWKMLGENCPETGEVPLMQHPTNGRKFSIATGRYTDEQAEAVAADATPAAAPAPPPAPPPPAAAVASAPTGSPPSDGGGAAISAVSPALEAARLEAAASRQRGRSESDEWPSA